MSGANPGCPAARPGPSDAALRGRAAMTDLLAALPAPIDRLDVLCVSVGAFLADLPPHLRQPCANVFADMARAALELDAAPADVPPPAPPAPDNAETLGMRLLQVLAPFDQTLCLGAVAFATSAVLTSYPPVEHALIARVMAEQIRERAHQRAMATLPTAGSA